MLVTLRTKIAPVLFAVGFSCLCSYVSLNQALGAPVNLTGLEVGNLAYESASNTCALSTTTVHSATYSARCNAVGAATSTIRLGGVAADGTLTVGLNQPTLYTEFWFRAATIPAATSEQIYLSSEASLATAKGEVRINSTGTLSIYDFNITNLVATGTTALVAGTWYRIGILASTGGGLTPYEVRINGVVELSGTMAQGAANNDYIFLGKTSNRNSQTVDFFFDDISFDTTAFPNNTKILPMLIDANGSTMQWTGGDATCNATPANCYTRVFEIPPDGGTSYIEKSAAASQVALMNFESASSAGIVPTALGISAIRASIVGAEGGAVASSLLCRVSSGGTTSDSGTFNGDTTYVRQVKINATDPNTAAAWTTSGLDALQIGCVDTSVTTASVRCTSLGVEVAFSDAAGAAGAIRGLLGAGK